MGLAPGMEHVTQAWPIEALILWGWLCDPSWSDKNHSWEYGPKYGKTLAFLWGLDCVVTAAIL